MVTEDLNPETGPYLYKQIHDKVDRFRGVFKTLSNIYFGDFFADMLMAWSR